MCSKDDKRRLDVKASPWHLCDFYGRRRYFTWITNPFLALVTPKCVEDARELLRRYECRREPKGTTPELIAYAKRVYESSIHPDTGCQIPMSARFSTMPYIQMCLTAAMVTFCRSMPAVWAWQVAGNGYHAHINYENGNGTAVRTTTNMVTALGTATVATTLVTIPFKSALSKALCRSRLRNFVPLAVVMVAHAVNVPLSRLHELRHGIDVYDIKGEKKYGTSRAAAIKGIGQVSLSRMILFAPMMLVVPFMTPSLERRCVIRRNPWLLPVAQVVISSAILTLMIPISLATFPQNAHIKIDSLKHVDPDLHRSIICSAQKWCKPVPPYLYFNKGL